MSESADNCIFQCGNFNVARGRDALAQQREDWICLGLLHAGRLDHKAIDKGIGRLKDRARVEIARKISFGSQFDRGLETREILMTVCDTLAQRHDDPVEALRQAVLRCTIGIDGQTASMHDVRN